MPLIKSISGIRGTIGGCEKESLTVVDVSKLVAAFGFLVKKQNKNDKTIIAIGMDARPTGPLFLSVAKNALNALGIDVIDLGMATTPTVAYYVQNHEIHAGIVITASHNPVNWNALKFLNTEGEIIDTPFGTEVVQLSDKADVLYETYDKIGVSKYDSSALYEHIQGIKDLDLVDAGAIKKRNFKVCFDAVNSIGGIAVKRVLEALGVRDIVAINDEPNGMFAHNPEPLPEHLGEIMERTEKEKCDVGFVVDPDVDRLAIIQENGTFFGEEYTIIALGDYVLQHEKGSTVSNLSSSIGSKHVAEKHGVPHYQSAVGELNVIEMMKEHHSVFGGEGSGGVIYPKLHYGRDALVGIALFLSFMAKSGKKCSEIRQMYPPYFMEKSKIKIQSQNDIEPLKKALLEEMNFSSHSLIDGLKMEFDNEWIHLRASNTEPIIRIYAESESAEKAKKLEQKIRNFLAQKSLI